MTFKRTVALKVDNIEHRSLPPTLKIPPSVFVSVVDFFSFFFFRFATLKERVASEQTRR